MAPMLGLLLGLTSISSAVPDVDTPLRTGARAPDDAAVIIGVEDYAFLPDVPHANRDARALYNWAVYTRGIPPERVQLLAGGNREQILDAVGRATEDTAGHVWITFAGHGASSPDSGQLLLVGDDAKTDPSVFVARSIAVDELVAVAGPRATLILDTCAAGKTRGGAELVPGARFAVPSGITSSGSAQVWTAAGPTQLAEPYDPAAHGLFTYFAVGALRGWADGELDGTPDGTVTLSEAQAFVSRAIATVHPAGQVPTATGHVVLQASAGLEPAPDLAALPKVGQPLQPLPPLTPPVPVPFLPKPQTGRRLSFAPPVVEGKGGLLEDQQGRTVQLSALMAATSGYADADRAVRRYQVAKAAQTTGGTMALTGGIVGAAIGVVALQSETPASVLGYLPYAGIGVLGVGAWGWGAAAAPKARKAYLETANSVLAP